MKSYRYILVLVLCTVSMVVMQAGRWTTHFAYNNVTQIALSQDKAYAVSDGSLFSVDKQTEQICVYNRQSGLHETGITCIYYDQVGRQLLIAYGNGKIDVLSESGVKYLGELYDKDMTQRKTIYNFTISGRIAYLSTHYGVQTMDLRENKLVDSYWLRPGGQETPIQDIVCQGDSIYAFTEDSLFCAALTDNLVDYTYWKRELRSGRIAPDATKGKQYKDGKAQWLAGGEEGLIRYTATERIAYKPNGPQLNMPYRLTAKQGHAWVVPGGRWSGQNKTQGVVMHYNGTQWRNIPAEAIQAKTGINALDFMNVAVDPKDINHYYVTSYGTGLYEFRQDTLVRHDIAGGDNTLVAIVEGAPANYTRLDNATYDKNGNLWLLDACTHDQLHCIEANGTWHAMNLVFANKNVEMNTPGGLAVDRNNPHLKWIALARASTNLGLLDDNGTWETRDDKTMFRNTWTNQHNEAYTPSFIFDMVQDTRGRVWIGTDQGVAYVDRQTDYFLSDAIVRPDVTDENGENPILTQRINAICSTPKGEIWIGSDGLGVYVLDSTATQLIAHYTTDNSAMPSSAILSLACDETGKVWIGTSDGLVEYDPNGFPEGLSGSTDEETSGFEMGSVMQWKLHLSYTNPTEVVATPHAIFALANGSLFSFDRKEGDLVYWSKATGLNGTNIAHIAYDKSSDLLVIGYTDGRIDLLSENGTVTQMPDLYMKAGSISATINGITSGSRHTFLAMPFGIIALTPRKGEVTDTYYIGNDAASIEIQQVLEMGDTLYAFSYDQLYKASLHDNLVDFSFWQTESVPCEQIQQAVVYQDKIYTLQHDSLYVREGSSWRLVRPEPINWIHASDGQLLLCTDNHILYRLADDEQLIGLCDRYAINDAVYSQGEYWLGENNWGLIRLNSEGDEIYHTSGPNSNFGYSMQAFNGQIYSTIGGRWAGEFIRPARMNIYDGYTWRGISEGALIQATGQLILDPVCVAVDPQDAGHFFLATYGTGVLEFRDYAVVKHYMSNNSTLKPVNESIYAPYYTRTDGAMWDNQGNLWVLNATDIGQPVHVLSPDGQWHALRLRVNGNYLTFTTPSGIWVDRRSTQRKWMLEQRVNQGVILLDDGGTPTYNGDDRCMKRGEFVDQNGKVLTPTYFRCFVQDRSDRIWIGTESGLFLITAETDFFTSNACHRIIIPRNDGTGLGDYLLGDEQINCMAVDGGNRIWIGTAGSGLYLIEDDTITVAHFTETNSLLPSNNIQSIAIHPTTGDVFVGTDNGIASYRSDASEEQEDMSNAYAYPNPVPPNYGGFISITGLMEDSEVRIIDAGGNLVCKTRSHGGTAVWDGKDAYGKRATPGIYTALCNAKGGHTAVKIMLMR